MLRHLGLLQQCAVIENALLYTLEQGVHTGDFGSKDTEAVGTTAFAQAIISNFGHTPKHNPKQAKANIPYTSTINALQQHPMLVTSNTLPLHIIGADVFVHSTQQPNEVAELCLQHVGHTYNLATISNRGTQVWPTGSKFTNLINQYRCRFESKDATPLQQADIIALYQQVAQSFTVCSIEILNMQDGKKMYSLAQGQ